MNLFLTLYYLFVEILPVINTMVNPLIYSFSNGEFRGEVCTIWTRFLGKTRNRGRRGGVKKRRGRSVVDLLTVEKTGPRSVCSSDM